MIDYLDVTFNVNYGICKPYHKPDNKITYINVQSNHPPNINNYVKKIEQLLSSNCSDVTMFNEATPLRCHAYLSKLDGACLFRCAWPFDLHYALIIH